MDIPSHSPPVSLGDSPGEDSDGDTLSNPQPGPSGSHGDVIRQFDPLVCPPETVSNSSSDEDFPASTQSQQQQQQQLFRQMLEKFSYNQSQRPRKGDVVSYFDLNCEDWMRVLIISMQKPSSVYPDYYNIRFLDLDRDDDSIP